MEFRIADTFTDSLSKLSNQEQKTVKQTSFDLQINPANPGMSFHKLDKARDKNFWSIRVSSDIRLIVHKTQNSLLLCYVEHHDKAYHWAERRKLEVHPKTGAAQLVEIRETIQEIVRPEYVEPEKPVSAGQLLFSHLKEDDLLSYGVPSDWIDDVKQADENTLLELADHLPKEAAEALLEIATGGEPKPAETAPTEADPFEHPDAQRRFRTMRNIEELERALEYPWEKWTIFLHPEQRSIVEREYNGPARVSGSAGTGKTIVALHRAVYVASQNPDSRVLLTTFSEPLANALRTRLRRLISNQPRLGERIEVHALDAIGQRLYERNLGKWNEPSLENLKEIIEKATTSVSDHNFSTRFLETEWQEIVDAWQLRSWEDYRVVKRLGRKTRLPEARRKVLWDIYEKVRENLTKQNLLTRAKMFDQITRHFSEKKSKPFDFIIVDESQDISVPQLKFLSALGKDKPNSLFFAGDLGQRIFQLPFSWKSLGVDIRGRSSTLRINYRTSHQIRTQADCLLGPEISDVDGITENRRGTISVFNGSKPDIRICRTTDEETDAVGEWLKNIIENGTKPEELGVFVRSDNEIERAKAAITKVGFSVKVLDEHVDTRVGHISVGTMHLAKGLEFRAVAVIACDDEILPLKERIEVVTDDSDLEEVYNTERHLLYVACTRARDHLLITSVEPASEFVDDVLQKIR